MSRLDPHLGGNAPISAHVPREPGAAPVGKAPPLGQKRIVFRYWMCAIAVGIALWVGIAYALGFI